MLGPAAGGFNFTTRFTTVTITVTRETLVFESHVSCRIPLSPGLERERGAFAVLKARSRGAGRAYLEAARWRTAFEGLDGGFERTTRVA